MDDDLIARLRNARIMLKSGDYDGVGLMRAWCAMADAADRLGEIKERGVEGASRCEAATPRARLEAALAKPLAGPASVSTEDFDPWGDVIEGVHGSYASESDDLFIGALKAVRDHQTFEFIKERGFVGEFALYVLSGHGFLEYGTSPRGGWWRHELEELLQPLIDKWTDHAAIRWA